MRMNQNRQRRGQPEERGQGALEQDARQSQDLAEEKSDNEGTGDN